MLTPILSFVMPLGMVPSGVVPFHILCGASWHDAFWHVMKVMDKEKRNITIGYDKKMGIRRAKKYIPVSHFPMVQTRENMNIYTCLSAFYPEYYLWYIASKSYGK